MFASSPPPTKIWNRNPARTFPSGSFLPSQRNSLFRSPAPRSHCGHSRTRPPFSKRIQLRLRQKNARAQRRRSRNSPALSMARQRPRTSQFSRAPGHRLPAGPHRAASSSARTFPRRRRKHSATLRHPARSPQRLRTRIHPPQTPGKSLEHDANRRRHRLRTFSPLPQNENPRHSCPRLTLLSAAPALCRLSWSPRFAAAAFRDRRLWERQNPINWDLGHRHRLKRINLLFPRNYRTTSTLTSVVPCLMKSRRRAAA